MIFVFDKWGMRGVGRASNPSYLHEARDGEMGCKNKQLIMIHLRQYMKKNLLFSAYNQTFFFVFLSPD
jgi:hypothetical protein